MIITTFFLLTLMTTAVYWYCKNCSVEPNHRALDNHCVSYTSASHNSLHYLPNVQRVSVVAGVNPQVTVDFIENPTQTLRKKTPRREKQHLRTRSASSSADDGPQSSETFEPKGGRLLSTD